MTSPETSNLYMNVRNNDIAWKNITIVDEEADGGRFASMIMGGFTKNKSLATLVFEAPRDGRPSLFD